MNRRRSAQARNPSIESLIRGDHSNPHDLLGVHREDSGYVFRALLPNLSEAKLVADDATVQMKRVRNEGVFEARLDAQPESYQYEIPRDGK
ncbi:MAG: GlgB N-terminal domain-containing protein, partial [Acidimicrobiia bacterium]